MDINTLTRLIGKGPTLAVLLAGIAIAGCGDVRVSEPSTSAEAPVRTYHEPEETPLPARQTRHRTFISEGIPVEYVSRTNPWPPTSAEIAAGGRLYAANCERCHDARGTGNGVAALDLTLPPAVLAAMVDKPYSVDQYLLWSISEGGLRSGSEMPAFKSTLTDREIWQIVNYMRSGFPPVDAEAG